MRQLIQSSLRSLIRQLRASVTVCGAPKSYMYLFESHSLKKEAVDPLKQGGYLVECDTGVDRWIEMILRITFS